MTVAATYTAPQYTGDGATTGFTFPYAFFATTDLVVILFDTATNANVSPQPVLGGTGTYDYAITGTQDVNLGEYPNGTITFNTAPLSNHRITIQRSIQAIQPITLLNTGPFPAKTIEGSLDRATLLVQHLLAQVARALVLNPSDVSSNFVMPAAGARANQVFLFDSSGNPTVGALPAGAVPISPAMQPVVAGASVLAAANLLLANGFAAGGDVGFPSLFGGNSAGRNRLRNSRMRLDQRNVGALQSSVASLTHVLDGWQFYATQAAKYDAQQNKGAVTPPAGFANYLGLSVAAGFAVAAGDDFSLIQRIEGTLLDDLAWGSASARPITIFAWIYTSVTGLHSGAIRNNAINRSYPFTFTVPVANTWTRICIQIPGDTTGTWPTGSGQMALINFSLGTGATFKGTAGAWAGANYSAATGAVSLVATTANTFYVTGIELRDGTWPANSAPEMPLGLTDSALNYRYFYKTNANIAIYANAGTAVDNTFQTIAFPAPMRVPPTATPIWASGTNNASNTIVSLNSFHCQAWLQSSTSGPFSVTLSPGTTFSAEL